MPNHTYFLGDTDTSIAIDKLLKLINLVGSGSEARAAIQDGMVTVNGKVERQGRMSLRKGDTIKFNENTIQVV